MKMWNETNMLSTFTGILLGLAALALLAALLLNVIKCPAISFRVIRIEAADGAVLHRICPETIRKTVLPHIHGNYFTVDGEAAALVFEEMPWVRKASVRRGWPDVLIVTLEVHPADEDGEAEHGNMGSALQMQGVLRAPAGLKAMQCADGR